MARVQIHNRRAGHGTGGTSWISYSDMMAALLLVFVLILSVSLYQYYSMLEKKTSELNAQQEQLSLQESQLEEQAAALLVKEKELEEKQTALDTAQSELADSRAELETTRADLDRQQKELDQQSAELTAARTRLDASQAELEASQRELTVSQNELKTAQQELTSAQAELTASQAELTASQAELAAAQRELAVSQAELVTSQQELAISQTELTAAQGDLDNANESLTAREADLLALQAALDVKQSELDAATLLVNAQKEALDSQAVRIDGLIGVRSRIIQDLSAALSKANISASVDPKTGDIMLESSVFFETGSDVIKKDGKKMLTEFIPVYLSVLLRDEYRDYLGEIIIEGHTDSSGTYDSNLKLSQERALQVALFCLNMDGLKNKQKEMLRVILTATGKSESDLVLDQYGNEDKNASRRVEFKFRLKDEEMIQEMDRILQSN